MSDEEMTRRDPVIEDPVIEENRQQLEQLIRKVWEKVEKDSKDGEYEQLQFFLETKGYNIVKEIESSRQSPAVASLHTSVHTPADDIPCERRLSRVLWKQSRGCSSLRALARGHKTITCSVKSRYPAYNNRITPFTVPVVRLNTKPASFSLPDFTTCIPVRKSYATEDSTVLTYIPYVEEETIDSFNAVGDANFDLYDTAEREHRMEFGPEHEQEEVNKKIDETIERCLTLELDQDQDQGLDERALKMILNAFAKVVDQPVEKLHGRYLHVVKDRAAKSSVVIDVSPADSGEENNDVGVDADVDVDHDARYLKGADSQRNMLCRRCYTYNCNHHGCMEKASLQLQYELAIQGQRERAAARTATSTEGSKETAADPFEHVTKLSVFHQTICKRMFLIFEGDISKMSMVMRAPKKLIEEYVKTQQFVVPVLELVGPLPKKSKLSVPYHSVRNYKSQWYSAINSEAIYPFFQPCVHDEPCSDETCSCVQNHVFCTLACAWGRRSPNFFRGCGCKGPCGNLCTCFKAKRDCDPDLCGRCETCSDPPLQLATRQTCRNDNIAMQRHRRVVVGKSPVAGFGLFARVVMEKGDYVGEYVGELITQEEGERRGRFYDMNNRSFLFNLTSDFVLDANRKGDKTRFINHSASPNCEARTLFSQGDYRLGFFATQHIEAQSELVFDYRYTDGMDNAPMAVSTQAVSWLQDETSESTTRKPARKRPPRKRPPTTTIKD